MMRFLPKLHSYPGRLVASIFILILLTTLSAGLPAYWLTHTELERQAWAQVANAEQTTQSLLRAEQVRLTALLNLLTERPTMRRLLHDNEEGNLRAYLRAFQTQTDLDILFLCAADGAPASGSATEDYCQQPIFDEGFYIFQGQPAILSRRPAPSETVQDPLAFAVAGRWLDESFLRQLASDTGVAQSILRSDGAAVAASTDVRLATDVSIHHLNDSPQGMERFLLNANGQHFYATVVPLFDGEGNRTMLLELALPVEDLFVTQRRAQAVLVFSTGAVALLGVLAGIWAVRRLTDPLEHLARSAEAISRGDLTASVPTLPGPQEVQTLSAALQRSQASMLSALDDLAQAHDWLEDLVQSIVEGVVIFDDDGRVTFINAEAASLVLLSVDDAIGRDIDNLFPVLDEAERQFSLRQLRVGSRQRITLEKNEGSNVRSPRLPGQRTARRLGRSANANAEPQAALEATATRLRSPGSDKMQTAVILRDISQEEQLRQLRSYFLANITHEFRTPLSTLNASMELLTEEDDLSAEEMRELLKPIHLSLLSLQTLIDNLLESSSIEAGRFVIRMHPVDIDQVIADAVRLVQPLLERREQALSLALPALVPPVQGDAPRLTQALVNLLSNASKYSPVRTPIHVTVEPVDDRVRVSVADRGAGIPADQRQSLFHRFVRLDADHSEQYGIGLGLHVVKTTVEAHSGQVMADENPGGGSIFWFELPIDAGEGEA